MEKFLENLSIKPPFRNKASIFQKMQQLICIFQDLVLYGLHFLMASTEPAWLAQSWRDMQLTVPFTWSCLCTIYLAVTMKYPRNVQFFLVQLWGLSNSNMHSFLNWSPPAKISPESIWRISKSVFTSHIVTVLRIFWHRQGWHPPWTYYSSRRWAFQLYLQSKRRCLVSIQKQDVPSHVGNFDEGSKVRSLGASGAGRSKQGSQGPKEQSVATDAESIC